jgi:hypothetical protein
VVPPPNANLRVLPLLGTVQIDDTVFATSRHGVLLVADRDANTIYAVTTAVWPLDAAYSAAAAVPATSTTPFRPMSVSSTSPVAPSCRWSLTSSARTAWPSLDFDEARIGMTLSLHPWQAPLVSAPQGRRRIAGATLDWPRGG